MNIPHHLLKTLIVAMMVFTFTCAFSQEQPIEKPAQIAKAEGQNEQDCAIAHTNKIICSSSNPIAKIPSGVEGANFDGEHQKEENWFSKFRTDPIVLLTLLLFLATVALWWATRCLVRGAEDTAQRQLRAYVSIKLADSMFYDSDGFLNAPFITKNNGATPANFMVSSFHIGFFKLPLEDEFDPPNYISTSSNTTLFPGEQVRQNIIFPKAFSPTITQAIKEGKGAIFVWGEVRYMDFSNTQRSTQCRMYSTGADFDGLELVFHYEGNRAD